MSGHLIDRVTCPWERRIAALKFCGLIDSSLPKQTFAKGGFRHIAVIQ
jgi:hypothetical protein